MEPTPESSAPGPLVRRHHLHFLGSKGDPMLFCHGFGMDQTLWRQVAPRFADAYRVVLMDLVGSGGSDPAAYRFERYRTLDGYVDDLARVCEDLDLRDLVFVGHSVGAMLGLAVACRMPGRFSRLVMLGASPRYLEAPGYPGGFTAAEVEDLLDGFDRNRPAWTEQLARTALDDAGTPETVREVGDRFMAADPAILRVFARATFHADFRELLGGCRTPSLLLQSPQDPLVPVGVSEYLGRAIPGATLRYLRSSGHFPQLTAPGEVVEAMGAFLSDGD